jgi:hypothetical protein
MFRLVPASTAASRAIPSLLPEDQAGGDAHCADQGIV